ncbi:MAG: Ankyrin repeat-containing protein [Lasallia pustulata]|uniref:Ankyrin repeat-containing domain n=1 Tax=Lasallia pustulata TaxID=136370 RepID=A0A1W5D451_9LECA|nr:MAG: Ankyrin repeat-containing protein [Lasallia pustulata]SLM37893.1 Ankyrin repeat-containing domain [Lasallia pustulata]
MPSITLPSLTEDDIDDLLYFARTGELRDLQNSLSALAKSSHVPQVDILSAAVNDDSGNGLLHMASANGHNETLKFLLSLLPRPPQTPSATDPNVINAQNSSGNTPLHWASLNGHLEAVKILVAAGADPALANKAGHDVVYEAEVNGKQEVVEWLLKEANGLEKGLGVNDGEGENGEEVEEGDGGEEKEGGENESEVHDLKEGMEKIQMAEKP